VEYGPVVTEGDGLFYVAGPVVDEEAFLGGRPRRRSLCTSRADLREHCHDLGRGFDHRLFGRDVEC
jgi:hypothetical protein